MSVLQMGPSDVTLDKAIAHNSCDVLGEQMLVAAAKSGQREAFEILCERSVRKAFHATIRITKSREDAEDALQDSLLRAFVHIKDFDGRASFSTWLTRIAINSALMILRKKRGSRELSIDSPADPSATESYWELPDRAPDPEKSFILREREKLLRAAILRLRPSIRRVVEIQELGEQSLKETANRLGISVAAAKARLFHGKAALRRSARLKMLGYGSTRRPALGIDDRGTAEASRRRFGMNISPMTHGSSKNGVRALSLERVSACSRAGAGG